MVTATCSAPQLTRLAKNQAADKGVLLKAHLLVAQRAKIAVREIA